MKLDEMTLILIIYHVKSYILLNLAALGPFRVDYRGSEMYTSGAGVVQSSQGGSRSRYFAVHYKRAIESWPPYDMPSGFPFCPLLFGGH
jgi:hypothetical protein